MPEKKQPLRINTTTVLVGLTLMSLVLNSLFIFFTTSEAQTIELLRQELQVLEQNEQIVSSAEDLYERYAEEIQTISQVFPNEETIPIFIQTLEAAIQTVASEYTFKFNSVTPLKEQDKLFLPLTITMKTDLPRFILFLETLEHMPYMTHVLGISTKTPQGFREVSEITLTIKVYVQNPFIHQ